VILVSATTSNTFDEGRDGNAPVLWQYVGPPDEPEGFCKLHRQ
jgi:hypothetical protein